MAAMNLAILLSQQGRNPEAETLLRQAVDTNPHNAAAAFDLGLLLAEISNKSEALQRLCERRCKLTRPWRKPRICRRAAEQRPGEPKYAFARAYYQLRNGKEKDAVATLDPLVKTYPSYGDAVLMLDGLYEKHGRVKEAAEVYDRALVTTGLPEEYRSQIAARRNALH